MTGRRKCDLGESGVQAAACGQAGGGFGRLGEDMRVPRGCEPFMRARLGSGYPGHGGRHSRAEQRGF